MQMSLGENIQYKVGESLKISRSMGISEKTFNIARLSSKRIRLKENWSVPEEDEEEEEEEEVEEEGLEEEKEEEKDDDEEELEDEEQENENEEEVEEEEEEEDDDEEEGLEEKEEEEEDDDEEELEDEEQENENQEEVEEAEDEEDIDKQIMKRNRPVSASLFDKKKQDGQAKKQWIMREYTETEELSGENYPEKKMYMFYKGKYRTKHENKDISSPFDKKVHRNPAKRYCLSSYKVNNEDAGSSNTEDEEFHGPPCKTQKPNEQILKKSESNTTESKTSPFESAERKQSRILSQNKCRVSEKKRNVIKEQKYIKDSALSNEEKPADLQIKRYVTKSGITERKRKRVVNKESSPNSDLEETEKEIDRKNVDHLMESCHMKGYNRYHKPFDDTLTASAFKNLSMNIDSVGALISCGRLVGTVFCAGDKYVLTAYHVFQSILETCRFRDEKTFINFNESPLTRPDVVFHLEKLAFSDQRLDVAVLEVSNPKRLPIKMKLNKQDHEKQDVHRVSVIGFGHPSHQKKTVDPGCSLIGPGSWRIKLTQNWLEERVHYHKRVIKNPGQNSEIVDNGLGNLNYFNFIFHSFMEQGVSGAPAIAAFEDGSMNVIGVVTHGTPELYFLLHPFIRSATFPCEHRYAMGTKMKDIYLSIRARDPKLVKALFC